MQEYREPLFHRGRVLKQQSLELLRDFPAGLARLGLAGWSDGVLCGFDISYPCGGEMTSGGEASPGAGEIIVGAGAVWDGGQIVLTGQEILPFAAYDKPVAVCLRLHPGRRTEDFYFRAAEFRLAEGGPGPGEFELGRFRLSEGARLRREYRDFRDLRTAYNTLDITRVQYAGPGGTTVSPQLLRVFARMILDSGAAREMDVNFALICLNQPPVSRECLLRYISRRAGEPYRELSHDEIYERLARIAGTGAGGMEPRRGGRGPAVI